ncbi:DUF6502 family protein [Granulosicoccus antarcticus]|uniref:Uncharacterized protein n=1 Tax=Granulosicoccus antarcticus IMCC3135 TaxID=1192854 RepID=A0A2Z2NGH8_9GAMM|nr:DUF6502 family protein [Granulosicoccus antarcticus]ASJ70163.1 hypothetical protein IMCC3135_00160 [Granulosicoccus antarcticus IMCC3135]
MHESLQKAVTKVLSPLVRLLLRHGVSHAEFANWAKQAYVTEASEHFGIKGKSPTVSRMAIMTGINRKEVKRIRELPSEVGTGVSKFNRAVRVVTGWLQDQEFQNDRGKPDVLRYGDPEDSFNQLVKRYGGDVPARAMLDELKRVGTVDHQEDKVTLQHAGYVPHQSESALLDIFALSATDLLTTLEHNLHKTDQRRLQMSVAYDDVTTEGREHFRKLSAKQGMALLKVLDKSLAGFDKGTTSSVTGEGSHRIGLGVYWIEDISSQDELAAASDKEDKPT